MRVHSTVYFPSCLLLSAGKTHTLLLLIHGEMDLFPVIHRLLVRHFHGPTLPTPSPQPAPCPSNSPGLSHVPLWSWVLPFSLLLAPCPVLLPPSVTVAVAVAIITQYCAVVPVISCLACMSDCAPRLPAQGDKCPNVVPGLIGCNQGPSPKVATNCCHHPCLFACSLLRP